MRSKKTTQKIKPKSVWYRLVTILMLTVNIVLASGLIASAYSGLVNPLHHPMASVAVISFPFWLSAVFLSVIISLFIRRITAFVGIIAICCSFPAVADFMPFNIPGRAQESDDAFTLMSYNALDFESQDGDYPTDYNQTLSYILNKDADIVCLQEVYTFSPSSRMHITPAQVDSLHAQYPYIFKACHGQAILSKFPVEPVQIDYKYEGKGSAEIACFRATIHGKTVTIFNVHLQSFELYNEDREIFLKLTKLDGDKQEMRQFQHRLLDKVQSAGRQRVLDAEQLVKYLRKYGGPNVIICGDFNDVPGCYSLGLLEKERMKQVYPEVGFGPMITYNAERFYFRIDHILYRGCFEPVAMTRGKIRTSDHYPIEATFKIINQ